MRLDKFGSLANLTEIILIARYVISFNSHRIISATTIDLMQTHTYTPIHTTRMVRSIVFKLINLGMVDRRSARSDF